MASRRVRIGDVPLWGRFRRLGTSAALGWCVRVTEHDYCEEEDVEEMRAAVAQFPARPGREHYASVDRLVELALKPGDETLFHLAVWNRACAFRDEDFARADKKDFLVPLEAP